MGFIDMHAHTTASDGALSPMELIDYALSKGLEGIAITDHDTIEGLKEVEAYLKEIQDFYFVPGVELSTEFEGEEVHILGYGIDCYNKELSEKLYEMQNHRKTRTMRIIQKLNALDFDISYEEVSALAEGVIGRPHIGQVLIEKGYAADMQEVFNTYLKIGGSAFVPRYKLTPKEAIGLIKNAGGIPVLAHPGLINDEKIINKIISFGIQGIEVYYPTHSKKQVEDFLLISKNNSLIITGGSDFHSIPNETNNRYDLGTCTVPLDNIVKIIEIIKK